MGIPVTNFCLYYHPDPVSSFKHCFGSFRNKEPEK